MSTDHMAMTPPPPPHCSLTMVKPSTHRKAWLDRIENQTRKQNVRTSWSSFSYLTTALILVLTLFTSTTSAQIATAGAGSSGFTMPTAFDTSIGNNFTETACKDWFSQFLVDIKPCYPISLMLQTSTSFFDATKNLVTITRVLDTSCNINYQQCSSLMSTYARQLTRSDTCLQDYKLLNPVLTQAYAGLLAYQPLYGATCLKDSSAFSSTGGSPAATHPSATSTAAPVNGGSPFGVNGKTKRQTNTTPSSSAGQYCFARAITNGTSPSGAYMYYLPLGSSLPGGTIPTCDSCLQSTMKGFASYASNSSQPISKTYGGAASDVNMFCGPTFVETSVAGGVGRIEASRWIVLLAAGVLGLWAVV